MPALPITIECGHTRMRDRVRLEGGTFRLDTSQRWGANLRTSALQPTSPSRAPTIPGLDSCKLHRMLPASVAPPFSSRSGKPCMPPT